jgi:hypothetical protein
LVELLVAAGLAVLIMAVISVAFQQGLTTFSHLKSSGDLADRLRSAQSLLRQDLESDHFSGNEVDTAADSPGRMKLSDLRYNDTTQRVPVGGFFRIEQGPGAPVVEGTDIDGLASTRALDHQLHFTIARSGNAEGDLFTGPGATAGVFTQSRFAEVWWKLSQVPTATPNGVPTYALLRYVRVLNDPRFALSAGLADMRAVQDPNRRMRLLTSVPAPVGAEIPPPDADSVVLTNVVSFEVKPTWQASTEIQPPQRTINNANNHDYPFDLMPPQVGGAPRVYDTYVPNSNRIRIQALKVTLRIYDPKNKMTRQSSIIVKQ